MNSTPDPVPVPTTDETLLWRGTPSQWTNLGVYLICLAIAAAIVAAYFMVPKSSVDVGAASLPAATLILAALAIPVLIALTRWIVTRCNVYEVTSERVKISRGLLSRHTHELELYRVRDYTLVEPFWLRLVGRGNVVLVTADRQNPNVVLRAVPRAGWLKDQIRAHTERMRQRRGVRDIEIDTQ